MKHFLLYLSCAFLFIAIDATAQIQINVVPKPVTVESTPGNFIFLKDVFVFNKSVNIPIDDLSALLILQLRKISGLQPKTTAKLKTQQKQIILELLQSPDKIIGEEGYTLKVTPQKIAISANQPAGLFYGVQTLLQLIPTEKQNGPVKIPCVNIVDYPRFVWRGLMLDVSRHFFTKEFVKSYIDQMAKYKLNVFHWHLTDNQGWRIEIKGLPELTQIGSWRVPRNGKFWTYDFPQPGEKATDGGFYTQEDIKEIVEYARKRSVTIVPEIDVPGHSLAFIASYPDACCTQKQYHVNAGFSHEKDDIVLCIGNEDNFRKLEIIFAQVAALFPGKYIHIGGDEASKEFWKKCPRCQKRMTDEGLKNEEELQSYFIKRMEKILASNGKKLIGWDEILEGGLSPNATVMSWRGVKGGIQAASEGHDVVMAPGDNLYIMQQQGDLNIERLFPGGKMLRASKVYDYDPVPEGLDPKHILGAQSNLWSEYVFNPRQAEYMTWPRALALSEILWSPKESRNWDDFTPRMEAQFPRFDQAQINYAPSVYDPIISTVNENGLLKIAFTSEIKGLDVYYSFNYTFPDNYAEKYQGPITIPKGALDIWAITYRNGKPVGRLLTISLEELKQRK